MADGWLMGGVGVVGGWVMGGVVVVAGGVGGWGGAVWGAWRADHARIGGGCLLTASFAPDDQSSIPQLHSGL